MLKLMSENVLEGIKEKSVRYFNKTAQSMQKYLLSKIYIKK